MISLASKIKELSRKVKPNKKVESKEAKKEAQKAKNAKDRFLKKVIV